MQRPVVQAGTPWRFINDHGFRYALCPTSLVPTDEASQVCTERLVSACGSAADL